MKSSGKCFVLFATLWFAVDGFCAAENVPAAHELRLWYQQPAKAWRESLFIGNGRLGGAVWGGVRSSRIDLNEDTLWSGEPYENINTNGLPALPEIRHLLLTGKELDAQKLVEQNLLGRYNENYLALGNLWMDFPTVGEATNYHRELDLNTAVVRETFEANGVTYVRETFASHPAEAIVVRLAASQPGKITFTASLDSLLRHTNGVGRQFYNLTGRCPSYSDCYRKRTSSYDTGPNPKGMTFEARLVAKNDGGKVRYIEAGVAAENCDAVTLMVVAATSYNGPHKSPSREGKDPAAECARDLKRISGRSYAKLLAEHVADYQKLFSRVAVGSGRVEIPLPADWKRYGHFTVGNPGALVTDGCFQELPDKKWGGSWISLLKVDWNQSRSIRWFPLVKHGSTWRSQDEHPHPVFDHAGNAIWFTSDKGGKRAVFRILGRSANGINF